MMKSKIMAFLILLTAGTGFAEEKTPDLLIGAVECLAVKQFLPHSATEVFRFGYSLNTNSYPGEGVVYIVNFTNRRRGGYVYALVLGKDQTKAASNIQNNARFVISKRDAGGVSFADPPLGGTWTQEHLASAIKQIENGPTFNISAEQLRGPGPNMSCESYTDR